MIKPIMSLLAEFYQFGADYFEKGKVNGEDVAAKLRYQLGEIYLENPESQTTWHFIGVWPHAVNFGELCFSSDPSFNLVITWKHKDLQFITLPLHKLDVAHKSSTTSFGIPCVSHK
jgi:hypothetical protein